MENTPINESINALREQINLIDSQILSLIEQRENCVLQIGTLKKQQFDPPVFFVPEREKEIIDRIEKNYKGKLPACVIGSIFQTIIFHCRELQK